MGANRERAIRILRDAALRDVGRLAVAQRAEPEIEREARPRRAQGHAHPTADFGHPRPIVAQRRGEAAIARTPELGDCSFTTTLRDDWTWVTEIGGGMRVVKLQSHELPNSAIAAS